MLLSVAWTRFVSPHSCEEAIAEVQQSLFDKIPKGLKGNVTGWLVYDSAQPMPAPSIVNRFNDFDDFALVPYDQKPLLPEPDQTITMDVVMNVLGDGKQ